MELMAATLTGRAEALKEQIVHCGYRGSHFELTVWLSCPPYQPKSGFRDWKNAYEKQTADSKITQNSVIMCLIPSSVRY